MNYHITGGCCFAGSNPAAEVLSHGEELFVMDNLFRSGSNLNLEWLRKRDKFQSHLYDFRNSAPLLKLFSLPESQLTIKMKCNVLDLRDRDPNVFAAHNSEIFETIGWLPLVSAESDVASSN